MPFLFAFGFVFHAVCTFFSVVVSLVGTVPMLSVAWKDAFPRWPIVRGTLNSACHCTPLFLYIRPAAMLVSVFIPGMCHYHSISLVDCSIVQTAVLCLSRTSALDVSSRMQWCKWLTKPQMKHITSYCNYPISWLNLVHCGLCVMFNSIL